MVYNNRIIAVIKNGGKILREDKNTVYIPFNSEYSIMLKNLNVVDAKLNIEIDGIDILNGSSIYLKANSDTEIHGFVENNTIKNKFKFIEKTEKISDHRGDKIDDGIIRITYQFYRENYSWTYPYYKPVYYETYPPIYFTSGAIYGCVSDSGLTVKGSEFNQNTDLTQQQCYTYSSITYDEADVIIIKLSGYKPNQSELVSTPIYVKTKIKCTTCGHASKSNIKYCPECGTYLLN